MVVHRGQREQTRVYLFYNSDLYFAKITFISSFPNYFQLKKKMSPESCWISTCHEWIYRGGCCNKMHRWIPSLCSFCRSKTITILPCSWDETFILLCTKFFSLSPFLAGKKKFISWTSPLWLIPQTFYLIGLRIKHLRRQVWRKVNYGVRSTENFQNDILKMSLPSLFSCLS